MTLTKSIKPSTRFADCYDREFLSQLKSAKYSGFAPRATQKLALKTAPRTLVNVDCNHILRTKPEERASLLPSVDFLLWLEAGKLPVPNVERPFSDVEGNMWRNVSHNTGLSLADTGHITSEVAQLYPISLPQASALGEYTYGRFLQDNPHFISDERLRKMAIQKTELDLNVFHELRLKSEMRDPPIGTNGRILPPKNFTQVQRLPQRSTIKLPGIPFVANKQHYGSDSHDLLSLPSSNKQQKRRYLAGTLPLKTNNPKYQRLITELQGRFAQDQEGIRTAEPANVRLLPPSKL